MPEGYKLWFSERFRGKFLETMFFTAPGYIYIKRFLLETLVRPRYMNTIFGRTVHDYRATSLYRRAKALYDVGESLTSPRKCKMCGGTATHFVAEGSESDGYVFPPPELYCEHHQPARDARRHVLPIKFSIVATFGHSGDQRRCMTHIRWLLGLDKRMTLEKAIAFFAVAMAERDVPPAPPPAPAVAMSHTSRSGPRAAPVVTHASTPTQLTLF